jgi:glycosyltransferase involved in cell wall biosynthesis
VKIVQVQTQAEAAGAQRVSDMVGEGLRARGHEVRTVFMYRKTDAYDADPHADFILTRKPRGALDLLRAIAGLIGYMRRERPDAVISYQHYGNIFGTLAGRLAGAKHLVANQSGAPGKHGGRLAAPVDRLMGQWGAYDYSVVNSAWMAEQFTDYPAAYRARVRRIDHGVPAPAAKLDRRAARAAFGLPDAAYLVVSSGRLTEGKNQRALVEAVALLPEVHLALAGVGPEHDALVALAAARGMTNRLHVVGEVPPNRIFEFLATGDLYAFASRTETFGLAVAEAAIAGLPVVSNDIAVLREVLGDAALYADAERPQDMAAAIRRVMSEAGLAVQLTVAGRALKERYSPAAMCRAYEELLAS